MSPLCQRGPGLALVMTRRQILLRILWWSSSLPRGAWPNISVRLEKTSIVRLGVMPEACGVKASAQRRWTSRTEIRLVTTAHECIGCATTHRDNGNVAYYRGYSDSNLAVETRATRGLSQRNRAVERWRAKAVGLGVLSWLLPEDRIPE